jgi:hypothetical protein
MASNKRINKAYVRYDGSGRVIPGSLILNRFKPKVGNWQETPAYLCCNEAPILALRLLFSNISEVGAGTHILIFLHMEVLSLLLKW